MNEKTKKILIWVKETLGLLMLLSIIVLLYHSTRLNLQTSHHASACNERIINTTTEVLQLRHQLLSTTEVKVIKLKILVLNKKVPPTLAHKTALSVHKYAKRFGMDPDLILSIIKNESHFDPKAISRAEAVGLMQVFPSWQRTSCEGLNMLDVDDNIHCGVKIYSFYEDIYVTVPLTLSVYNRGPNPVDHDLAKGKNPVNTYASTVIATYNRLKTIGGSGAGS